MRFQLAFGYDRLASLARIASIRSAAVGLPTGTDNERPMSPTLLRRRASSPSASLLAVDLCRTALLELLRAFSGGGNATVDELEVWEDAGATSAECAVRLGEALCFLLNFTWVASLLTTMTCEPSGPHSQVAWWFAL